MEEYKGGGAWPLPTGEEKSYCLVWRGPESCWRTSGFSFPPRHPKWTTFSQQLCASRKGVRTHYISYLGQRSFH